MYILKWIFFCKEIIFCVFKFQDKENLVISVGAHCPRTPRWEFWKGCYGKPTRTGSFSNPLALWCDYKRGFDGKKWLCHWRSGMQQWCVFQSKNKFPASSQCEVSLICLMHLEKFRRLHFLKVKRVVSEDSSSYHTRYCHTIPSSFHLWSCKTSDDISDFDYS